MTMTSALLKLFKTAILFGSTSLLCISVVFVMERDRVVLDGESMKQRSLTWYQRWNPVVNKDFRWVQVADDAWNPVVNDGQSDFRWVQQVPDDAWNPVVNVTTTTPSAEASRLNTSNPLVIDQKTSSTPMLNLTIQKHVPQVMIQSNGKEQILTDGRKLKYVVILTYQRVGSTFFGSLFNLNSNTFYQFEPLDALYSALYGTEPGWNAPSDLYTYSNGAQRVLPPEDLAAVAQHIHRVLTCNVDKLPTESLVHKFWSDWKHESSGNWRFTRCLSTYRFIQQNLAWGIHAHCGQRFGQRTPDRVAECRQLMTNETFSQLYPNGNVATQFKQYRDRTDNELRNKVDRSCTPYLKQSCSAKPLRVIKSVRATMESMEPLLRVEPELKVIHLVRDPRPTALSRLAYHPSARSIYSEHNILDRSEKLIREAAVYCRQVVSDTTVRRRLEKTFPGRLLSLTYEQLSDNPMRWAEEIYRFIDEPLPTNVRNSFQLQANGGSMGNGVAAKTAVKRWLRNSLTEREFGEIKSKCAEMFQLYPEYQNVFPETYASDRHANLFHRF